MEEVPYSPPLCGSGLQELPPPLPRMTMIYRLGKTVWTGRIRMGTLCDVKGYKRTGSFKDHAGSERTAGSMIFLLPGREGIAHQKKTRIGTCSMRIGIAAPKEGSEDVFEPELGSVDVKDALFGPSGPRRQGTADNIPHHTRNNPGSRLTNMIYKMTSQYTVHMLSRQWDSVAQSHSWWALPAIRRTLSSSMAPAILPGLTSDMGSRAPATPRVPAPSSPLPTEILLTIFAILCEVDPGRLDEYHVPTQLLAITHTCRLFREACINTPSLWTCLPYGWSSELLALWLDRVAAKLPLDIVAYRLGRCFFYPIPKGATDQYHRLLGTAHRWRSVHLIKCDYVSLSKFMIWTNSLLVATHLEELNIRVSPIEVDKPGTFPFSMHHRNFRTQLTGEIGQQRPMSNLEITSPTNPLFPFLTQLTLYCAPFEFSVAGILATVVDLCVHVPFIHEWEEWREILMQARALVSLRITAQGEVDGEVTDPIELPCLRVLDLGIATHKSFLSLWFQDVTTPELRKFILTSARERWCYTDEELISELLVFVTETPLLEEIFLHGNFPFIHQFLKMLAVLTQSVHESGDFPVPRLHTLSLAMNIHEPNDPPMPLAFLQESINLRRHASICIKSRPHFVQPLRALVLSQCSVEEYAWFSTRVENVSVQPDLGMTVSNALLMFDGLKVDYTETAKYWEVSD
ncbi:hypothetical protein DL93DRAFT_2155923 [Clavulina sp. PMI_390]|nr:hypothetical protein DL93DRAFT_2155923 [Clavulina sp. PMI_390]